MIGSSIQSVDDLLKKHRPKLALPKETIHLKTPIDSTLTALSVSKYIKYKSILGDEKTTYIDTSISYHLKMEKI